MDMAQLQSDYTATELAILIGTSQQAVDKRARRESWTRYPREGRGGGYCYRVEELPAEMRERVAMAIMHAGQPDNSHPALPEPAQALQLTARQRETMIARLAFVREIERQAALVGKDKAILNIIGALDDGTLPPHLLGLVSQANARYGDGTKRSLSRRRLYAWCRLYAEGGETALAPITTGPDMSIPAWAPAFMAHYQRPQKPTMVDAYNDMCRDWQGTPPSIYAVRRWLKKVALPELEAGRCTGNALLKLRPHKRRSTEELWPGDVYTADGTTFDAEIQHPYSGNPFKPEVTMVIDVATRMCVGVSVGVSESALTILDALRMACIVGGIPAMLYADNGSGYRNNLLERTGTGMLARLGIELTNSIPGRPQGKGLMERAVKTLTAPYAKSLATCTHADMDPDAAKKIFKLTRAAIRAGNYSRMPIWQDFLAGLKARIIQYNETPHRGLPKVTINDVCRHYSPVEYWQYYQSLGWEPVTVPEYMRDELFMPGEHRKVRNGMVQFLGGRYYSDDLADWHGDEVEIRYDIWDSSYVTVWTSRGEKICTAELDANVIPYFPLSRIEAARANRERAQISRLEAKAERIVPGARIELPEVHEPITFVADSVTQPREAVLVEVAPEQLQAARVEQAAPAAARPVFRYASERYRWLMRNARAWTPEDRPWLETYTDSEEYAEIAELYANEGLDWATMSLKLCAPKQEGQQ